MFGKNLTESFDAQEKHKQWNIRDMGLIVDPENNYLQLFECEQTKLRWWTLQTLYQLNQSMLAYWNTAEPKQSFAVFVLFVP